MGMEFVLSLSEAKHELLQVLLKNFTLSRAGGGVVLDVAFSFSSPTIWLKKAKPKLDSPEKKDWAIGLQAELRRFLQEGRGLKLEVQAPIPFRYGNGGTLPIVRFRQKDYYCLFLRDVNPIGWNIANGSSDTLNELFHPSQTIERELAEELFIVDPKRHQRYVLTCDDGRQLVGVDRHSVIRLWERQVPMIPFRSLRPRNLGITWISGPDAVKISVDDESTTSSGYFLNINATDLGIEVDRIGFVVLSDTAILCDGELVDGKLLDRPIGLFDIGKMDVLVETDCEGTSFRPDLIFHRGTFYEDGQSKLDDVVRAFGNDLLLQFPDRVSQANEMAHHQRYPLCPVTQGILKCAAKSERPLFPYRRVFVGHGSDARWKRVLEFLSSMLGSDAVSAFDTESTASRHILDILKRLLDTTDIAVIVATKDDATADAKQRARQNVIHEIGLFQGHLGFDHVIVIQEEGLEWLSNLDGV